MPMNMAISAALSLLIMALIPSATSKDTSSRGQPLNTAIEEMQRANYFAFVMLLNMVPADKIPSNITFLMPNNRRLAKAIIPNKDVLDFLLRHSIPSTLGFEYLRHFPSGSVIPSSDPKFMLKVSNNGRRSYFLNNVKLISPNICTDGSSIRCHGVDGVLLDRNKTVASPASYPSPPITMASPPSLPSPPGGDSFDLAPAAAPQPAGSDPGPRKSGSSHSAYDGSLLNYMWQLVLLLMLCCYL